MPLPPSRLTAAICFEGVVERKFTASQRCEEWGLDLGLCYSRDEKADASLVVSIAKMRVGNLGFYHFEGMQQDDHADLTAGGRCSATWVA